MKAMEVYGLVSLLSRYFRHPDQEKGNVISLAHGGTNCNQLENLFEETIPVR